MDKRRKNIITDVNDPRLFPDGAVPDDEELNFTMSLTQASSLYLIATFATTGVKGRIEQLTKQLTDKPPVADIPLINDELYVMKEVLQDIEFFKKESTEIINELS